jgi:hypothetical protein
MTKITGQPTTRRLVFYKRQKKKLRRKDFQFDQLVKRDSEFTLYVRVKSIFYVFLDIII